MAYSVSGFNKSFADAFAPALQQSAAAYNTAQRDKMQERIQKEAQATQRNQQIIDEASKVGASPVMNPDGSLNAAATFGLIANKQAQMDKIKKAAEREDAYNFDLSKKAATFGLGAKPAQTQQPGGGLPQYLANPGAAPMAQPAEEPLERQLFEAERKAAAEKKMSERLSGSQAELAKYIPYLPNGRADVTMDESGNFDDATAKRLMDAQADYNLNQTRQPQIFAARDDMETMYPDLKPGTPEYNVRLNQRKAYHTGSMAYKNAINQVGELFAADPKEWRKEVDRVAALGGFSQPKASPAMAKTLIDWNTLQSNQQKLLEMISEFDDKYPQSPFSSYVGPIDNRTLKANLLVNDKASPAVKDAQKILGFYQGIANQRLKDISGAAVTEPEFERFLKEAGDAGSANFVNAVQGWHDSTASKYQSQLNAMSGYSFPESIARVNGKMPEEWVGFYSRGREQAPAAPVASDVLPSMSAIDAELARRANR